MKNKSLKELTMRLNEITIERVDLEIKLMTLDKEYNQIVYELWQRVPPLKNDLNIQPKEKVRKNENKYK